MAFWLLAHRQIFRVQMDRDNRLIQINDENKLPQGDEREVRRDVFQQSLDGALPRRCITCAAHNSVQTLADCVNECNKANLYRPPVLIVAVFDRA